MILDLWENKFTLFLSGGRSSEFNGVVGKRFHREPLHPFRIEC